MQTHLIYIFLEAAPVDQLEIGSKLLWHLFFHLLKNPPAQQAELPVLRLLLINHSNKQPSKHMME